jgi:galactokinase
MVNRDNQDAAPDRACGDSLTAHFRARMGRQAEFLVRAPGRVNLLGEHTDYNGLPVLPMAIDRCIRIAGARRPDRRVVAINADEEFPARVFALAGSIPPAGPGDWCNYVKAAAQGLCDGGHELHCGADLLIDGDIPAGAGLSSSAALVVAAGLALLTANDLTLPRPVLAELLAHAEHYVGTMSGGMDQAVSLLAVPSHALRIDFYPLRTRPVALPPDCAIVVCDSLVSAHKAGAARDAYNLRVAECALASAVLATMLGTPLQRLGDLAVLLPDRPLASVLPRVGTALPEEPVTLDEVARVVGMPVPALRAAARIPPGVGDRFQLRRRARHVLSEADRVNAAEVALSTGDADEFGRLMVASHASCRDDYEVSCPALEALTMAATEAGALGARLTGAGFGGCTVNLVKTGQLDHFLEAVDRHFYQSRLPPSEPASRHRFVFSPQGGATVTLR